MVDTHHDRCYYTNMDNKEHMMSKQPEALRLASLLQNMGHKDVRLEAAGYELRRQHGEIKSMRTERLRSERRLSAVEAQRDALLELLDRAADTLHECGLRDEIYAAIKAVEEGK